MEQKKEVVCLKLSYTDEKHNSIGIVLRVKVTLTMVQRRLIIFICCHIRATPYVIWGVNIFYFIVGKQIFSSV